MKKKWWVMLVPAAIGIVTICFIVTLLFVKILWGWIVPDLFPGAVAQGLIVGSISWYTALKLAVVTAVLASLPFNGKSFKFTW